VEEFEALRPPRVRGGPGKESGEGFDAPEGAFPDQSPLLLPKVEEPPSPSGVSGYPSARVIPPEDTRPVTPPGPHPDKKSAQFDVYGRKRRPPKPISRAYINVNKEFCEVEGEVDRRVRTVSVAHKKNATHAPSVMTVRKTGQHVSLGGGVEQRAKGMLPEMGLDDPAENFMMSSTLQGLGNPNCLVDVSPGVCRFGLLRQGGIYRMSFHLRNLDVDVTRFNVKSPVAAGDERAPHPFVGVHYVPQLLAPGMAGKVTVEILASAPTKVEYSVEVKVKAHTVKVPVSARIVDAGEYDRLDMESLSLHGRHIGRCGKDGPVQEVSDENYCIKMLGDKFMAPPAHASMHMSQENSAAEGIPTMPTLGQQMPLGRRGSSEG